MDAIKAYLVQKWTGYKPYAYVFATGFVLGALFL
jgi:hypothetical protein